MARLITKACSPEVPTACPLHEDLLPRVRLKLVALSHYEALCQARPRATSKANWPGVENQGEIGILRRWNESAPGKMLPP